MQEHDRTQQKGNPQENAKEVASLDEGVRCFFFASKPFHLFLESHLLVVARPRILATLAEFDQSQLANLHLHFVASRISTTFVLGDEVLPYIELPVLAHDANLRDFSYFSYLKAIHENFSIFFCRHLKHNHMGHGKFDNIDIIFITLRRKASGYPF